MRCHIFFTAIQKKWIKRAKAMNLEITDDMYENMVNGGSCSVFDIIEELKVAFKDQPDVLKRLLLAMKPDCLVGCTDQKQVLAFTIMKVTKKIAHLGSEIKKIFQLWDNDGNGNRKCKVL